jgi:transposase
MTAVVAQAQEDDPRTPTTPNMTIGTLEPVPVGTRVTVHVTMKGRDDRLLDNLPLVLYVDGVQVRRARTDEDGEATIRISEDLEIGTHNISVEFGGIQDYYPVIQNTTVTIRPIQFEVRTVPPLEDVEFVLGGKIIVTGEDGIARAELDKAGTYTLEAIPLENDYVDDDTRAEFQRWSDSTFTPERTFEVRGDDYVEAGYIISHRAEQTFHDLQGEPVDYSRITSITLKTTTGDYYTIEDGSPRWYQALRINRSREGLETTQIMYSVESVIIDGSNVVNRYQQRFFVEPNDTWDIELLMFFATIRAKDALFGFTVGDGINVEYPNGEIIFYPYNEDGVVQLGPLARGAYKVQAGGVGGMAPITPVVLSKDQDVYLKVMTTLDIATFLGTGIFGALGLLFIGRPFLLTLPFRMVSSLRKRGRISQPSPAPVPMPAYASGGNGSFAVADVNVSRNGHHIERLDSERAMDTAPSPVAAVRQLKQLKAVAADDSIRARADMILLSRNGLSPEQIADEVSFSPRTVKRYINRYESEGIAGLFNRPIYTNLSAVDPGYCELLETVIQVHPTQVNFRYENWTAERLSLYLAAQTGTYVVVDEIEKYLSDIGWYGEDDEMQDTQPTRTIHSEDDAFDETEPTRIIAEDDYDDTVPTPIMAEEDFDETEPTYPLNLDDDEELEDTVASTALNENVRVIPYHQELIAGNSSFRQQEAKAKRKRWG